MTKRSRPHLLLAFICVLALAGFGSGVRKQFVEQHDNTTNSTVQWGGGWRYDQHRGPISTSSGGGLSDSQFCSLAKKWSANEAKQVTALTGAGRHLKTFYTTLAKEYQQVSQAAPSEIKPDLNVLIGVFNKFYVVLQQSNFDFQKAATKLAGLAASFNSAQVKQAVAHLQAWAKANNCGIKTSSG